MNGPFGCPWLTFTAVLVALGAIIAALVWAFFVHLED